MLSLPEDITSFTKKGRKGYYTFLSYISFSFLFLLDKDTSCQRLFMQLLNLISANKEFWIWKRFCLIQAWFNYFFTFSDTKLPLHRNQKVRLLRHEVREGEHSVPERIWIKGSYLSQWLPQGERWPPRESKSWCIEILHGGSH